MRTDATWARVSCELTPPSLPPTCPRPMPRPANPPPPLPASALTVADLALLHPGKQTQLLISACCAHRTVYESVLAAIEAQLLEDGKTDISFDYLAKQAWKNLNPSSQSTTYAARHSVKPAGQRKKFTVGKDQNDPSRATDKTETLSPLERTTLLDSLSAHLKTITDKTSAYSSWETRLSALVTLRKIGSSLVLSQTPSALAARASDFPKKVLTALKHVTALMSEEERREWIEDEVREELGELFEAWQAAGLSAGWALGTILVRLDLHGQDDVEEEDGGEVELDDGQPDRAQQNGKTNGQPGVIALDSSSDVEEDASSKKKHRIS